MNKTKKGFLKAGTILTIVSAAFAILFSFILFFSTTLITEDFFIEDYKEDGYVLVEEADGYYLKYNDPELGEIRLEDEEIETLVVLTSAVVIFFGVGTFAISVARLIISIILLNKTCKNKYSKGLTITLLVLSIITGSWIEVALLVTALCLKNKVENPIENTPNQQQIEQ